mmetsp:Transcript_54066/g.80298  ORF Transcript_54066/g.80298 Transcript_54066/m.80298 type:complete len:220 (+) Transcript_54066:2-661(+)
MRTKPSLFFGTFSESRTKSVSSRVYSNAINQLGRAAPRSSCRDFSSDDMSNHVRKETFSNVVSENVPTQVMDQGKQDYFQQHDQLKDVFDVTVPEGRCIGVRHNSSLIDALSGHNHWLHQSLHPDEIVFGGNLRGITNRNTFFLGRLAIRKALQKIVTESSVGGNSQKKQELSFYPCTSQGQKPILKDKNGRPALPKGFLGSISHKKKCGCRSCRSLWR